MVFTQNGTNNAISTLITINVIFLIVPTTKFNVCCIIQSMKVRLIENDQEDNEGTLYNVLQIMHVYVMFENQIKKIKKVQVMINDYDVALITYTEKMYIVTLFTDNNTYININTMVPSIEIKQIQNGESNDKIIQVTSTNFIKGMIREISLQEKTIFQKELPIQYDINLYSNV